MAATARTRVKQHTALVGALTSVSRVLGLVREMLQSRLIGAGVEQSAFTLAFAIPNLARKLFGEGALTAAFVPIFKGEVENGAVESARRLARAVMTTVLLALGAAAGLASLALGLVAHFQADLLSPRALLTLRLVKILLPYMIFICGAAFGMGILNALGRFFEGALMPALLNAIWIVALALLAFFPTLSLSERATWVCIAILLGGFAQMAFLFRCLTRHGYPPKFLLLKASTTEPELAAKTRLVWKNTFIGAAGAGAVQINCALDQVLAQCAAPWAAGVIGYAERLMDLPLGVVAVAFGTVLLPTFAGMFARGELDEARKTLADSLVNLMFLMVPAFVGLAVLAREITAVVYEGNAFDAVATLRVSRALAIYAAGLVFFGFQKTLIPWFQAQKDLQSPLRVTLVSVVLNAALNVLAVATLPVEWRHAGLALSTVVTALIGSLMLLYLARRRNGQLGLRRTLKPLVGIALAAGAMGVALLALKPCLAGLNRILALAIAIAAGAAVYGAFVWPLVLRRSAIRIQWRRR